MVKNSLLFLTFSLAFATPYAAPLCPPSNAVNVEGIGDGCSIPDGVDIAFPQIGAFQSAFTPACNRHDKCYSTLGTTTSECNDQFLADMRRSCRISPGARPVALSFLPSLPNPFDPRPPKPPTPPGLPTPPGFPSPTDPLEDPVCNDVARQYFLAVKLYSDSYPERIKSIQAEALSRSRQLENQVNSGICETSPEGTTLYSNSLIYKINNAFVSSVGRNPSTSEFFRVINSGTFLNDRATWEANLGTSAQQAVASSSMARLMPALQFLLSD